MFAFTLDTSPLLPNIREGSVDQHASRTAVSWPTRLGRNEYSVGASLSNGVFGGMWHAFIADPLFPDSITSVFAVKPKRGGMSDILMAPM